MKVPEKIYISTNSQDGTYYISNQYKRLIEYTRTDAFIEKAYNWLSKNSPDYINYFISHYFGKFVEDFKKYMGADYGMD